MSAERAPIFRLPPDDSSLTSETAPFPASPWTPAAASPSPAARTTAASRPPRPRPPLSPPRLRDRRRPPRARDAARRRRPGPATSRAQPRRGGSRARRLSLPAAANPRRVLSVREQVIRRGVIVVVRVCEVRHERVAVQTRGGERRDARFVQRGGVDAAAADACGGTAAARRGRRHPRAAPCRHPGHRPRPDSRSRARASTCSPAPARTSRASRGLLAEYSRRGHESPSRRIPAS